LKGNRVNLELVERPDLPLLHRWVNDVDFVGELEPFEQATDDGVVIGREHRVREPLAGDEVRRVPDEVLPVLAGLRRLARHRARGASPG